MRSIFEYLDYRDPLKDAFEERKASMPFYGYRMMAETLGLDTSYIFRLLQKDTHLPARCQSRAISFLGLSGRSSEYFTLMVAYARERNSKARKEILDKAMALRDVARHQLLDGEVAYFQDWWIVALRSMLEIVDGKVVPKELASRLNPPISEEDVTRAFALLQGLGLVKRASSNRLALSDTHLTVGTGIEKVQAVRHYQRQILALAAESLDRFSPERRDVSVITLAVDAEKALLIKEMLRECRRQIQKCVEEVPHPDRVMQMAMAFFPVCEAKDKV
jgi:uncharacterized protein (TIGR02147 family)